MVRSARSVLSDRCVHRRRFTVLVLVALLWTVLSVPALAARTGASTPQPVPFHTLVTQPFVIAPCSRPCYEVILNQRRLARVWRGVGSPASPLPTIDFVHNAVVAASWGELSDSADWTIAVTRVVRVSGTLQVHVRQSFPFHPGLPGLTGLTTLVEVPRSSTRVQFIVQTDTDNCGDDLFTICQVVWGDTTSFGPPKIQCRKHPSDITYVSCYAPHKIALAQSLIQPHPRNPSAAVARLTHLALHRIIDANWVEESAGPTRPHFIEYLYGTQPTSLYDIDRTRRHPTFVDILEGPPRGFGYDTPKQPIAMQFLVHIGAINDPNAPQTIVPGPWEFEVQIPKTNLWITVVADGKRSSVHSLGLRILKALG